MEMNCPKCHAPMRSYERNGVTVEQCTDCRGLFLDRGELERLIAAEQGWHAGTDDRHYDDHRYDEHRYDEHHHRSDDRYRYQHGHKKKRRSFLEDLFD